MLSSWLFTSAIAVATLFGTSFGAPRANEGDVQVDSLNTINLLKDELPRYDKSKDKDGLLKLTYTAIENLVKAEKAKDRKREVSRKGGCDLTKVKVRRDWYVAFAHGYSYILTVRIGPISRMATRKATSKLFTVLLLNHQDMTP
jgi:hypothetical protein